MNRKNSKASKSANQSQ